MEENFEREVEDNTKEPTPAEVQMGEHVAEGVWVSPEAAAIYRGEVVEIRRDLLVEEE